MCTSSSQCPEGNVCVEGQCVPRPVIVDPIKPKPASTQSKKKGKK